MLLYYFIFLLVLGFEFRALHFLNKTSTTWAIPSFLFPLVYFSGRVIISLFFRGEDGVDFKPWYPISVSLVAGHAPPQLASFIFFLNHKFTHVFQMPHSVDFLHLIGHNYITCSLLGRKEFEEVVLFSWAQSCHNQDWGSQ
jgi:hypothetical protein